MTVDDIMKVRNVLDPRISPDGSEVVHVVSVVDDDRGKYDSDLWLVGVKDGNTTQLTRSLGRDDSPRWSPDGKSIAFLSDRAGSSQVWLLPRKGGEAKRATSHATAVGEYAWSPDGRSIAFLARDPDSEEQKRRERERGDVAVVDQNRKNSHLHLVDLEAGKSRRLTSGDFHVASFSWSPDGQHIAYASGPTSHAEDDKHRDIHLLHVSDGKSQTLVKRPGLDTMPRFSPDGKKIAFLSRNGNADPLAEVGLCIIAIDGGKPHAISSTFTGTILSSQESVEWDPDSGSLYFAATRGTLRHLCKVADQSSAKEMVLTPAEGFEDRFTLSADGKRIAYLRDTPATTAEVWFLDRSEPNRVSRRRLTDTNPEIRRMNLG
jgi:Tol biopolymer transport system component